MKYLASILGIVAFSLAGCSHDGPFDPTLLNDGFTGITYTNEFGEIIGPVDPDDWQLYAGPPDYPIAFKGNVIAAILPEGFETAAAYPNPSNSQISFTFAFSEAVEWSLKIINDNYVAVRTISGYSEAGIAVITWDLCDENGNKLPDDIYRAVYDFGSCSGYGDVWISDYRSEK